MLKRTLVSKISLRAHLRVLALLVMVGWAGLSAQEPSELLVNGGVTPSLDGHHAQHAGLLDDILDLLDDLFGDGDDETDPPDDEPIPGSGDGW